MADKVKPLVLDSWPRKQQFDFFRKLDWPYVGLCADVDVTMLLDHCRRHGQSDYRAMVFAILSVFNQLEWSRWRIRGEQVVEHSALDAGITALGPDDQVRLTRVPWQPQWSEFDAGAQAAIATAEQSPTLFAAVDDGAAETDGVIYLSCLPWVRFTQMTNPVPVIEPDSIPRIVWGRYDVQRERTLMPVAIQVHHGLADGLHLGQFYRALQSKLDTSQSWLPTQ